MRIDRPGIGMGIFADFICVTIFFAVFVTANILLWGTTLQAESELKGRVGNYSSYFISPEDRRLRHHRYELHLDQKTAYSSRFRTFIQGRFRFDATLMDHPYATRRHYPKSVTENEMAEGELRQLYFDYLGDTIQVSAGMQFLDWVDSFSPLTNDILAPIDLRHGGLGAPEEVLVPQGLLKLSHQGLGGKFQWLVVPLQQRSRVPKGANGYGLYERIGTEFSDVPLEISHQSQEFGVDHSGAGLRYSFQSADIGGAFWAFRGHQSRPAIAVENIQQGRSYEVEFVVPPVTTYGFSFSSSGEAWVGKLLGFYQPYREPPVIVVNDTGTEKPYEKRLRLGIGLDYVFSKHLKVYSEQFYTRSERLPKYEEKESQDSGDDDDDDDALWFRPSLTPMLLAERDYPTEKDNLRQEYLGAVRLTNETFTGIVFQLDGTYAAPFRAFVVSPEVRWTFWQDYRLSLGGRFIRSLHERSPFEVIKGASQVYLGLFRYFSLESE